MPVLEKQLPPQDSVCTSALFVDSNCRLSGLAKPFYVDCLKNTNYFDNEEAVFLMYWALHGSSDVAAALLSYDQLVSHF